MGVTSIPLERILRYVASGHTSDAISMVAHLATECEKDWPESSGGQEVIVSGCNMSKRDVKSLLSELTAMLQTLVDWKHEALNAHKRPHKKMWKIEGYADNCYVIADSLEEASDFFKRREAASESQLPELWPEPIKHKLVASDDPLDRMTGLCIASQLCRPGDREEEESEGGES